MPLKRLVPSLLRVAKSNLDNVPNTPSFEPPSNSIHPSLATHLVPTLLTPRTASHKYRMHIPELLNAEGPSQDAETNIIWYSMRHERIETNDQSDIHEQEVAEEEWKHIWLERMERREVMIQILLHFLLLSLIDPSKNAAEDMEPLLLCSPRKSKKEDRVDHKSRSFDVMEAHLESFMDKLSMWQLTTALDRTVGGHEPTPKLNPKGKGRQFDERDWMQVFYEDVIEPQFKSSLPSQCALLRSKIFPSSPFSDDDDSYGRSSPSSESMNVHKHAKASGSSRQQSPHMRTDHSILDDRQLARSGSLSLTLEQERERSRSVSIGPGNTRKRAMVREVSMTTAFKGKTKPRPKDKLQKRTTSAIDPAPSRTGMEKPTKDTSKSKKSQGKTLVVATPVKSKRQSQSSNHPIKPGVSPPSKLPKISLDGPGAEPVEGDSDDDEWMFPASPDIVLLGSNKTKSSGEVGELNGTNDKASGVTGSGNIWVATTPTKLSRSGTWQ